MIFAFLRLTCFLLLLSSLFASILHEKITVLDNATALALYVKGGTQGVWEYRGCVTVNEPSNTFSLTWPVDENGNSFELAEIGVSLEPIEECLQKDNKISGNKEMFAQRVALDLWNFLKSFTTGTETHLVVPKDVFDRWYEKFQTKFRRDPDFITRQVNVI